jgi:hypothetical protein
MTDIKTIIERLEILKESFAESYSEKIDESVMLKSTKQIRINEWDRAFLLGKIEAIADALDMLSEEE